MSGSHEGFLDLNKACVLLRKFRCCRYGNSPLWKKHFTLVLFRLRTYDEKCHFIEYYLSLLDEQDSWLRMQLNGLWFEYAHFPPNQAATYNETQFRDWRDNALIFMDWLVRFDLTLLARRMSWTNVSLSSQAFGHRAREHDDWMDVLRFWTDLLFPPSNWSSDLSSSDDVPPISIVCSPRLESTQTPSRQGTEPLENEPTYAETRVSPNIEGIPSARCALTAPYPAFSPANFTHPLEASPIVNPAPPSDFDPARPVSPSPSRKRRMNGHAEFPALEPVAESAIPGRIVLPEVSFTSDPIPRLSKRKALHDEEALLPSFYCSPSTKRAKR
ncbi:hypothetical protein PENSPDRAFT_686298 [Peniophora sp. CONT]|nr:hypothetical protein PENSPDRAFT_686298 [Peniophora sp. CONT]